MQVTKYKMTVRSLRRRLFGAWCDNYKTNITLTGNHVGNTANRWLSNNNYVSVSWKGSYSRATPGQEHTFEMFLPYYSPLGLSSSDGNLITEGETPQIYQSWHTGRATRNGRTAICTTTYN